jgi:cytochrome P450
VYGLSDPVFDVAFRTGRFMQFRLHVINAPEMIGHVLLDHHANYPRPPLFRTMFEPSIGNGLLVAEGEDWRLQRKIVAPTFSPAAVIAMTQSMQAITASHVAGWPARGGMFDMDQMATDATMAIIAGTLFAGDREIASAEAGRKVRQLVAVVGQPRMLTVLGLQRYDPSPGMARARAAARAVRGSLARLVRERREQPGQTDFFSGLLRAFDGAMPASEADRLMLDNAVTFFAAGFETTATALAWTIYLLAAQPDLQEAARAEAQAALSGDAAGLAERLPLLHQIFDESMRLYPPVVQIVRQAAADDVIGDLKIRKGDLIFVYPWVVHRHRQLWDQPDAFDHARFAPQARAAQQRFQYLPFGAGPRICVGARFALVEALIILAHWLAARRFSLQRRDAADCGAAGLRLIPKCDDSDSLHFGQARGALEHFQAVMHQHLSSLV